MADELKETQQVPWHQPGKWLVNPAYWDQQAVAERGNRAERVGFVDATLAEADDCIGHMLGWHTRLALMERMHAIGVREITLPSHASPQEEADLARAYRRLGLSTPLLAKGPGIKPPLSGDWRGAIHRQVDLGAETISPTFYWSFADTASDFQRDISVEMIEQTIREGVSYACQQGVRVMPAAGDAMRTRLESSCRFFRAMVESGADGVVIGDTRGNSAPLATRLYVQRVREAVANAEISVGLHNDMGLVTANALAAVEGGATSIDATILGIAERGGYLALEEAAPLFAMYGVETGIRLEGLYDLAMFARDAFGVQLTPWKPIAGQNWNKEEGLSHMGGAFGHEATIGLAPEVVGREFEAVIGAKILFGRERSTDTYGDSAFLRGLVSEWGMTPSDEQFQAIMLRARAALASAHDAGCITVHQFRAICDGVLEVSPNGSPEALEG